MIEIRASTETDIKGKEKRVVYETVRSEQSCSALFLRTSVGRDIERAGPILEREIGMLAASKVRVDWEESEETIPKPVWHDLSAAAEPSLLPIVNRWGKRKCSSEHRRRRMILGTTWSVIALTPCVLDPHYMSSFKRTGRPAEEEPQGLSDMYFQPRVIRL